MFRRHSQAAPNAAEPCLLRRAQSDPAAFGLFYDEHAEPVLVFLTARVVDVEIALDLMSETFAIALETSDRFRGRTDAEAAAWLFAIARSQLSRYWRSGKAERAALARLGVEPARLSDPEIERLEELAAVADVGRRIKPAMRRLHPDQRRAVQLRVLKEFEYSEIAAQLDVSEQVARSRVSRGLRALEHALATDRIGGAAS